MPRIARVVAPEFPHHVIQRGNRCQRVFFNEDDYKEYLKLLDANSCRFNVDILAYCLMPNHVHLIAIPLKNGNLAQAIGETHRQYTRTVNFRENWKGYLWQGRFSSYVLDEMYLMAATRYILLNPVEADLVKKPWDYEWSSAKFHMGKEDVSFINDGLLKVIISNWEDFLNVAFKNDNSQLFQMHERTGRPLGDVAFTERLEKLFERRLKKKRAGRKKKDK